MDKPDKLDNEREAHRIEQDTRGQDLGRQVPGSAGHSRGSKRPDENIKWMRLKNSRPPERRRRRTKQLVADLHHGCIRHPMFNSQLGGPGVSRSLGRYFWVSPCSIRHF
jgi:hypothetical protein